MPNKKEIIAGIIIICNEVLSGRTKDINTSTIAIWLNSLGIIVNDNSLRKIIKNDELYIKDDKFSRTEYEKFLITSGVTAPTFETNIAEQEKKRQFLSSLSGGIVVPEILVNKEYRKENQSKTIRYIDLEKFHSKYNPTDEDKKDGTEKIHRNEGPTRLGHTILYDT